MDSPAQPAPPAHALRATAPAFIITVVPMSMSTEISMAAALDLPVPPLCALRAETAIHPGERTVVELIDGRKLIGKLDSFDADKGKIGILIEGQEKIKKLGMHELRLMRIPHPRKWQRDDDSILTTAKGVRVSTEPLEFEIEFTDHSTIDGVSFGFRNGRHGIHLFPVQNSDQYTHLFVPNNAIAKHRIGKHLGQQLIKDKVVSDQDVAMVLLEQQEHRSRALGEQLTLTTVVGTEQLERALQHQQTMPHLQLGEILVQDRLISRQQLDAALIQQQRQRHLTLGELLTARGVIKQEDIQKSLASKLGIPLVDLRQFPLDPAVLKLVDETIAIRHTVMPLRRYQGKLVVAMEDPTHWETLDTLHAITGHPIDPVMAVRADLSWAIDYYYRAGHTSPPPAPAAAPAPAANTPPTSKIDPGPPPAAAAPQQKPAVSDAASSIATAPNKPGVETTAPSEAVNRDTAAADFLRELILGAAREESNAIHLESVPQHGARIRLRQNSELIEHGAITAELWPQLLAELRVLAHFDARHGDGAHIGLIERSFLYPTTLEVRVYYIPTFDGEHDVVLKITSLSHQRALTELGFSDGNLKRIDELTLDGHGLFLVCGPTGSGKTTLLHALLLHLNHGGKKIWMLDNTERNMPANIRHVRLGNGLDAPHDDPIEALLGADPDLVMINPLSQPRLAQQAVSGALAGPQILAGLAARGSGEAVERLANMGVPRYELADALNAVLTQRPVKRLCEHCKKSYAPSADELRGLAVEYFADHHAADKLAARMEESREKILEKWRKTWGSGKGQLLLHRAGGCKHCQKTGYAGQLSLHELLEVSPPVRQAILDGAVAVAVAVHRAAIATGLKTLKQDGIEKVLQGHTDLVQVRAACAR